MPRGKHSKKNLEASRGRHSRGAIESSDTETSNDENGAEDLKPSQSSAPSMSPAPTQAEQDDAPNGTGVPERTETPATRSLSALERELPSIEPSDDADEAGDLADTTPANAGSFPDEDPTLDEGVSEELELHRVADQAFIDDLASSVARELGMDESEAHVSADLTMPYGRPVDADSTAEIPLEEDAATVMPEPDDATSALNDDLDMTEPDETVLYDEGLDASEIDGTVVYDEGLAAPAMDDETVLYAAPPATGPVDDHTEFMPVAPLDASAAAPSKPKRRHRGLKITLLVIACLLAAIYFGGVVFFTTHFSPYTRVSDVDCSYKTVSQAEADIQSRVSNYTLLVTSRGDADGTQSNSDPISGSAIDLHYNKDGKINSELHSQNPFTWPSRLLSGMLSNTYENLQVDVDYNQSMLEREVNQLSCMNLSNMVAPADATLYFNGTSYAVQKEVLGTTLDTSAVQQAVATAVSNTEEKVDLEQEGCYQNPSVYSNDEMLLKKVDFFNQNARITITYDMGGGATETLDGNTLINWYDFDANGNATLNEDRLSQWVADLAAKYDTVGTSRTFTSVTGSTITVSGGTYGWQIDQDAEIAAIKDDLSAQRSESREPNWASKAVSHTSPEWGNTYIEVSISAQHWWYVQNGSVVLESDCVTGKPDGEHDTPTGVYDILDKQSPYTMHGDQHEDGSYDYVTECSYWLRVTWTGVGFHDASWQPTFGGTRYLVGGSHGCINCPTTAAASLYNTCAVGTPVIIHS
jgi:hypothetical protein